jgi:hypothetical protein
MALKASAIQRIARIAARSPALRSTLVRVLNRVPGIKARLRRELARASTLAAQAPASTSVADPDDLLLSREARLALDDLRAARGRSDARSVSDA